MKSGVDPLILNFEIKRQLFHMFFGMGIALTYMHLGNLGLILLTLFLMFCVFVSLIYDTFHLSLARFFIERFGRIDEKETFVGKGGIIYLATSLIVLFVFPPKIALAAIMVCAFGDSLSHLYGRYYGRLPGWFSEQKKLDGTIVGIVAGMFGALFFVEFILAFSGALVAMMIESSDWIHQHLDDNFTVISSAAIAMFLIQYLFYTA